MPKQNRIPRSKDDLKRELRDQLQLLRHACQTYDSGLEAVGKHISLSLRVLLHQHGQSRALLDQLGYRAARFHDTAGPLNPRNLLTECNLVGMEMSPTGARYMPVVVMGGGPLPAKRIQFASWWNDPVLKDNRGRTFCRRELVLHVADTDGAAHVDAGLEEGYMDLSRRNSLGWIFGNGNVESALSGRPELACMRQIAHEVLCTLHESATEFRDCSEPVVPV
jgi:hypothetical protein